MARIVPLYKKNSKTHVGNYRPISVLSVISKVFEQVVFLQLSDYLSENTIQLYNTIELYCPVNGKFVCSVRVKVNKNTIVI